MLKSQVPVYFCSLAIVIATPTEANPGHSITDPGKKIVYAAAKTRTAASKKNKITVVPDKHGMKFVHAYIRNNDDCLHIVRRRSEKPFTIIDSVLDHYGLPRELKYLAVIESELKPTALSRVGARGPWQLMPETAHVFGLKTKRGADDRNNYYMSTRAAAKYLKDLHDQFGDWLLVLAAYNGGPAPVYRAIKKAHSRDFWVLQRYLPAESRMHVKKFIATAYYFEGGNNAGTVAPPAPASPTIIPVTAAVAPAPGTLHETPNERFNRIMNESARSLRASNELTSSTRSIHF